MRCGVGGSKAPVSRVLLAGDGDRVISCSEDTTIRVCELGEHAHSMTARVIGRTESRSYSGGVNVEYLVEKDDGATNFIVGLAAYQPLKGQFPYHWHTASEVIFVLEGTLPILVAERHHLLGKLDVIQIPPNTSLNDVYGNTVHFSSNPSKDTTAKFLWGLNTPRLHWNFVEADLVRSIALRSRPLRPVSVFPSR